MSFILKIVEGPNKGAEIALVDGVAVTLGKSDDCDIILADPTLPDEPLAMEANADGVTAGGETLAQFAVKTIGATSFAVGPADAPWAELKWPSSDPAKEEESPEPESASGDSAPRAPSEPQEEEESQKPPRRHGCLGCLVVLVLLLVAAAAVAWFYRDDAAEFCKERDWNFQKLVDVVWHPGQSGEIFVETKQTLADVARKYGLSLEGEVLSGNLATRRERLAATAEAYAAQPGAELDISDDESFRNAAEDALFTLTEGALTVVSATNRFIAIKGVSRSAAALKKTLEALSADLPRLRNADVSGVRFGTVAVSDATDGAVDASEAQPVLRANTAPASYSFPVCGILTTPYPCLIARDGKRYLEGAVLDSGVIVKIEADSVTLTNSTGRFTWKP